MRRSSLWTWVFTVSRPIDSAAAIYMDIINLFLRILRILGRKRD